MVWIGVSGHRFLTEFEKLQTGVDQALVRIEQAFPGQDMSVVSSLAEGADRLVAQRALLRGARLIVPLPLPQEDYLVDFTTPGSQQEFQELLARAAEVITLPPAETRNAAYEAAGLYVLDHCDVLLVVWDGQGAQGQGGTGAIVAEARHRGLPLAWVKCGNRKPGTDAAVSLGEEQGELSIERLN